MLFSLYWSFHYHESDFYPILNSVAYTSGIGIILFFLSKPRRLELNIRDGFVLVTSAWMVTALFCALPGYISGAFPTFTDSFFEAVSGLTSTGASVLGRPSTSQIEDFPQGILFWRSFTQFIGGMGIIVFSIAILPLLGFGGFQLFRTEVAGSVTDKLTPRIKQASKALWGIYVGFVLIETLILKLEGMSLFDALCHAFGTMATGGFSTKTTSVGFFDSPLIEWTIIFFMFAAATNFSLHFSALTNRQFRYFKDAEFKFYFWIIIVLSLIITLNISHYELGWKLANFRHSLFTTVSLITTTGFRTEDFETWPSLSKVIIFLMLFIGGSAGSVTGALKIIRTVLVIKYLAVEFRRLVYPNGVFLLSIGGKVVPDNVVRNTLGFYLFYILIFVTASLIFSSTGMDIITATTASASALGNVGPGLGSIGPMENWGHFPQFAKWVAGFCMILGRLEIFTIAVLFTKSFWRQ